jgi:hypothetical protein
MKFTNPEHLLVIWDVTVILNDTIYDHCASITK